MNGRPQALYCDHKNAFVLMREPADPADAHVPLGQADLGEIICCGGFGGTSSLLHLWVFAPLWNAKTTIYGLLLEFAK
jgi:hypothetical protein